jgi:hypothetical protein
VGDVFAMGEDVSQADQVFAAGHLGSMAEGADHSSFGPSGNLCAVLVFERGFGEHDLRERRLEDLYDLRPAALVNAHTAVVADAEFLPPAVNTK